MPAGSIPTPDLSCPPTPESSFPPSLPSLLSSSSPPSSSPPSSSSPSKSSRASPRRTLCKYFGRVAFSSLVNGGGASLCNRARLPTFAGTHFPRSSSVTPEICLVASKCARCAASLRESTRFCCISYWPRYRARPINGATHDKRIVLSLRRIMAAPVFVLMTRLSRLQFENPTLFLALTLNRNPSPASRSASRASLADKADADTLANILNGPPVARLLVNSYMVTRLPLTCPGRSQPTVIVLQVVATTNGQGGGEGTVGFVVISTHVDGAPSPNWFKPVTHTR